MRVQSGLDAMMKSLRNLCMALCAVGASASGYVILVRLPSIASTKLDLLFGTLQGVAVGLLFAIAALLVNLTYMVRRENRPSANPSVGDGNNHGVQLDPSA
jgi:hypothetical protein